MQWMQDGEKYSIYLSGISRRDKRLVNWETTRLLIPGFSSLSLTSPFIRASTLKGYNLINYSFQWNFTEMYINYVLKLSFISDSINILPDTKQKFEQFVHIY